MQKQINMEINYNNEVISVRRDASLSQLMRNRKLMKCPISVWYDLLKEKDHTVSVSTLREVLLK